VKKDSVVIERVRGTAESGPDVGSAAGERDLWRVTSPTGGAETCTVTGKRAAVDLALSRLNGTGGELYIREEPGKEPEPFNPAGA
jgi:hypothetical protein